MSTFDDRPLSDEEREELERRQREGLPALDEEIARRYSPDRLSRILVRGMGKGEKLDLATRAQMDRLLPGYDFSSVRVLRGPLAEEITKRHSADAITVSNSGIVLMREGARSSPGTTSGQALLAHELTHVAQAQRGMMFAKEGGSEGEGEPEAEEVEAEAHDASHSARDVDSGSSNDTNRAGDPSTEARKTDAKRKAVVDRAIEMLRDQERFFRERLGIFK
jgi:hypothetical protein